MYAASNGEDLTTARRRLLLMLRIGATDSNESSKPAVGKTGSSQDHSEDSLRLSSYEISE
jgi:hypothetical protein